MIEKAIAFTRQTWVACLLLVLLTLPLCVGLFQGHLIKAPDSLAGLMMALYMNKYIGDGQFFIRWASEINLGYGYPMFNFYMPFFYFLTVFFSKIIGNVTLGLNLSCITFWMVSGIGMYLFARELWGHKGALLSAIAYVYAPYHIQDLYARGAFAEFSAFAFFPLILLILLKFNQTFQRRYVFLGSLSIFALCLTHTLMNMIFLPVILSYAIFLYTSKRDPRCLTWTLFMMLTGVMMAAFYLFPAFWEKQYLNLNFLISMRNDFHKHFVSLAQLFHVPWDRSTDMDGISFQIGLVHVVLAFLPLGFIAVFLKKNRPAALQYFFFLGITLLSIFFTLPAAVLFWENISLLKFVQFPWRFLVAISFGVALLAGATMVVFNHKTVSHVIFIAAIGCMIAFSIRFFYPAKFMEIHQASAEQGLFSYLFLGEGVNTPRWIKIPVLKAPIEKFELVRGEAKLFEYKRINSIEHAIRIQASQPSLICFHSYYFPGWRAFVDGHEVPIDPNSNPYGLIVFPVPQGEHTIKLVFGSTPVRNLGSTVSWAGLALLIFGLYRMKPVRSGK